MYLYNTNYQITLMQKVSSKALFYHEYAVAKNGSMTADNNAGHPLVHFHFRAWLILFFYVYSRKIMFHLFDELLLASHYIIIKVIKYDRR